ncbi:hypothetical protein [Solilutibacter oculi]|uniref:hypothetical protein n=1 Tax=Solilutibacter oculi TaxID=2698682 RepID=UPI0013A67EFF|nr:hypothetical protein [Lysobacter oculi]
MKLLVGITLAFILTGCATKGIPAASAAPVGPEGKIVADAFMAAPGRELVTVVRDEGFSGSGCSAEILIDGNHVASLRAGQKAELYLAVGRRILGARPGGMAICRAQSSRAQREVDIVVEAGKPMTYRLALAGELSITPSTL